jgi:hypothetical protein
MEMTDTELRAKIREALISKKVYQYTVKYITTGLLIDKTNVPEDLDENTAASKVSEILKASTCAVGRIHEETIFTDVALDDKHEFTLSYKLNPDSDRDQILNYKILEIKFLKEISYAEISASNFESTVDKAFDDYKSNPNAKKELEKLWSKEDKKYN